MPKNLQMGIMFKRQNAPEQLPAFVQQTEQAGFDELWVVEDCFYASGIASAAIALAETERIRVGLGIMPAVARNAAFTAMEIATLSRIYPGRFLPGIGHGVAEWMRQMGAFPKSQLNALEETTATVRSLLAGKEVNFTGQHVQMDQVSLVFPPSEAPIISLGVRGPKSLQLSGRVADGTILAECSSPAYIRWAKEQIIQGQLTAGRDGELHRLTVFAFCIINDDRELAYQQARSHIAAAIGRGRVRAQLTPMGILAAYDRMLAEGGIDHLAAEMPDEWVSQLTLAGTPQDCQAAIQGLVEAGADSIVLVPIEPEIKIMNSIAEQLLPMPG